MDADKMIVASGLFDCRLGTGVMHLLFGNFLGICVDLRLSAVQLPLLG